MAKQRRAVKAARTVKHKAATPKRAARKASPAPRKRQALAVRRAPAQPAPPPQAPPPPPRKPGFYEAVAIYERGVQALQRHDYHAAANHFRAVVSGYPDERELLERARLYLRVCERETSRAATGAEVAGRARLRRDGCPQFRATTPARSTTSSAHSAKTPTATTPTT